MHAVVFGAGNIGRGFLGSILSQSGMSVCFVDVDEDRVKRLAQAGAYPVYVVSERGRDEHVVTGVSAVSVRDTDAIVKAIVAADIVMTAVGKNALSAIAPVLARGLAARTLVRPRESVHLTVVACENVQDNTSYLKQAIGTRVSEEERGRIFAHVSFPDCVVDRIVPNMSSDDDSTDPLSVCVEDYFQLAIDGSALKEPAPPIRGMEVTYDLDATLEQKLCTLNMAHAIVGYYGYLVGCEYVHEAMEDKNILALLHGALEEVSDVIVRRHLSITKSAQDSYACKVVDRFKNRYLRDEVVRVARDPERKLGARDRLVRPAQFAIEQHTTPAFLVSGITAALHFDYARDAAARRIVDAIRDDGLEQVLESVSGISRDAALARMIRADYHLRDL